MGLYLVIGKLFVWGCVAWVSYKLVAYVLERLFNLIMGRFRITFYFIEFLTYRADFKEFVKDKKRHYKIKSSK